MKKTIAKYRQLINNSYCFFIIIVINAFISKLSNADKKKIFMDKLWLCLSIKGYDLKVIEGLFPFPLLKYGIANMFLEF